MHYLTKFIGVLFMIILLASCEEKMVVIPDLGDIDSDRVVLIEEFTGVACPQCPGGSQQVEDLIAEFPNNVIAVGIHTDFLGEPFPDSQFDFRTEEGEMLEDYLGGYLGKPAASFNRIFQESANYTLVSFPNTWPPYFHAEVEKFAKVHVDVETVYDEVSRDLGINVLITAQENIAGDLRISVMLTESHIIDKQIDGSTYIDDYEHNHVLRDMLTNTEGETLIGTMTGGQTVTRMYTYTIPPEDGWWVAANMEVVAFVSLITADTREVLQAGSAHVVE